MWDTVRRSDSEGGPSWKNILSMPLGAIAS